MFTTPFTFMKQAGGGGTLSCVVQCFTSNSTWSCCTGAFCVEVVAVGAGGGGRCSSPFTSFGQCQALLGGPGGGAGGISICTLTSGFGTSQSIVIGTSSAENGGGPSCFGTLVCAGGGGVGQAPYAVSTTNTCITASGGAGGVGNMGTSPAGGCTTAITPPNYTCNSGAAGGATTGFPGGGGGGGSTSTTNFGNTTRGAGGAGGAGSTLCGITLGAGGEGGNATRTGVPGCSYGGGGGGGTVWTDGSPRYAGGAGGSGIIKVTQYILS